MIKLETDPNLDETPNKMTGRSKPAGQQTAVFLKHLDEVVSQRLHARNLLEVGTHQEPQIALWQMFCQWNLHQLSFMRRDQVAWKERNAIARPSRSGLGRLSIGTK